MHNYVRTGPASRGRRTASAGRLRLVALGALVSLVGVLLMIPAAQAAIVNPPPDGEIVAFPQRDMVEGGPYAPGQEVLVRVVRGGFVIGQSHAMADSTGGVLVNHPPEPGETVVNCWETVTPDIRPFDEVQFITDPSANVGTATTVANVIAGPAERDPGDPSVIVIHGTAADAAGNPLPLDSIEQRLINPALFEGNGRRSLRAPGDGTLLYDAPGSINWTATYSGLSEADQSKALAAQSRILWLGFLPAGAIDPTEITIFEEDEVNGPVAPCTAPSATAPIIDLVAASDSGSSNTDNLTRILRPTFLILAQGGQGTSVKLYADGVQVASGTAGAGGLVRLTPSTPLSEGVRQMTASEPLFGGEFFSDPLAVTIDRTAPTLVSSGNLYMSPNGDLLRDTLNASASSGEASMLSIEVLNLSLSSVLFSSSNASPGLSHSVVWDGMSGGSLVADGEYRRRTKAVDAAGNARIHVAKLFVDTAAPVISGLSVTPSFNPCAGESAAAIFSINEAANVYGRITRNGVIVKRLPAQVSPAGGRSHTFVWDGTDQNGNLLPPGNNYRFVVNPVDLASNGASASRPVAMTHSMSGGLCA